MDKISLEDLLEAARKLPIEQQRQLVEQLMKNANRAGEDQSMAQTALEAVEQTRGAMQGLDRETIIWLAEDEELCGY
ncbi:MAG TPA: hypothetical protein VNN73_08230 [Blastocatellia bacterium]|nr:hypothetical protein [Blastocatellia bacterium]